MLKALLSALAIALTFIAFLKKSDITITRLDWSFFIMAMVSIPVWYFTRDPTWAVILLTSIDVVGFGPTIRKAFAHPYDEDLTFFALFVLRNVLVIAALENYTIATLLFPAVIGLVCLLFVILIIYRRGAFRQV
ncbi:MAG: hypothetical protein ABW096_16705 [Candidatus Thiodiazotropha sp.]